MTDEQIVLEEIRRVISPHPEKEKIEAMARLIRNTVEVNGEVAQIAIALVGAELAARP